MYKIPAKTLFLGKNLIFVPECHSTNTLASELSQKAATADGTVVVTDCQLSGRGQRGNVWEAEPGLNLTFSLILKPTFLSVKDQFYLNISTSLAVYDYLCDKSVEGVRIKWPNDVLVNDNKICGILIENQIQGSRIINTVIGIGLNVNQQRFEIDKATSLSLVTQQQSDLPTALEDLLQKVEARYLQLREKKFSFLMESYLACLYWREQKRMFTSQNQKFEGILVGVDEDGRVEIKTDDGVKAFGVKELGYLR